MLSKKFEHDWNTCQRCPLHKLARRHVIGLGDLPADVVFIGEAPGPKEDLLGKPFIGPAGHLLWKMILEAIEIYDEPKSWDDVFLHLIWAAGIRAYITNVVACAPWKDTDRKEWRQPTPKECEACRPRLDEIILQAKPKLIVLVGKVSKLMFKPPKGVATLTIEHPAHILYMGVQPDTTVIYHQIVHRLREAFDQIGVKKC